MFQTTNQSSNGTLMGVRRGSKRKKKLRDVSNTLGKMIDFNGRNEGLRGFHRDE